jgi:hypothetical protein
MRILDKMLAKMPITINVHTHTPTPAAAKEMQPDHTVPGVVRHGPTRKPWIELPSWPDIEAGKYEVKLTKLYW